MALLGEVFDINSLPEAQNNFDLLPDGWYNATVANAEVRPTKDKTGQYISMRYNINGPTHQGRVVFGNINIKNKSTQAEEIGRQQLGALMRSIGLARVDDTDQLIGGTLLIKVGTQKSEGYEPSNDVRGFKTIEGGSMPKVDTPAIAAQSDGKAAPPWAKK